ncbi:hypothetical protein C8Q78DRAFT_1162389 [Trametes maxima]|nr:hypothetical protein C8Q78DRAFT_1162389 [Trametes maxima]
MRPKKKSKIDATATASSNGSPTSGPAGETEVPVAHGRLTSGDPRPSHAHARRNIRGRRGGLKDMPGMPLDILIEIFSLMHPRDLLNLARTSKEFRAFLVSRSSAPFWKAARQQVEDLPECPPFLSEPQYANLLFFTYCHKCLKPNIQTIIWEFYVRYCQTCKNAMLVPDDYGCAEDYFYKSVQEVTGVKGPLFITAHIFASGRSRYGHLYLHKPDFETAKAQWNTKTTDQEKVRFAEDLANATRERETAINALKTWKVNQASTRATELEDIKRARYESIVKRLREEGWGEEIDKMTPHIVYDLIHHKAVRKAQKLTEGGWQSIKHDVLTHMESVRATRLDCEWVALIRTRLGFLCDILTEYEASLGRITTPSELQAGFADIAMMDPFRGLVEAPLSKDVTLQDFRELHDAIPEAMATWYHDREEEFLALVPEEIKAPDGTSPLKLAIVSFECRSCGRSDMRWPAVLAHNCERTCYYLGDRYRCAVARISMSRGVRGIRKLDKIFAFSKRRASLACGVIEACGRAPDVVTHEEMDRCRARLVCMSCSPITMRGYRMAQNWTKAIAHKYHRYECPGEPEWVLLNAQDTEKVLEHEAVHLPPVFDGPRCVYRCTRCRHRDYAIPAEHCLTAHGVTTPVVEEDYYIHPDAVQSTSFAIRVYPAIDKGGFDVDGADRDVSQGLAIYSSTISG